MNTLLLFLPLLTTGTTTAACTSVVLPAATVEESNGSRNVALDIEILRRLLIQAVDQTSPEDDGVEVRSSWPNTLSTSAARQAFNYSFFTNKAGRVAHSVGYARGFHMPGLGAVYHMDVTLPVVEVEPPRESESEEDYADDVWRQMEREVQGGDQSNTAYSSLLFAVRDANQKHYAIDEDAIEEVRDAVIATVARHGRRIEVLRQDEDIVVSLRITPGHAPMVYTSTNDDEEEGNVSWLTGYAALSAEPVNVVIRLPRVDLDGDPDAARRRATVHRY